MTNQPNPPQKPFMEQLALRQTGENEFEMINLPQKMGNPLDIAYGGYTIAVACKAACLTVPDGYNLYSLQGNYLGPAYTDRPLRASVRVIRQTRTFATRQVEVSQTTTPKEGQKEESRICLLATADFIISSPTSLLSYSHTHTHPSWRDCPTPEAAFTALVDKGTVPKKMKQAHEKGFNLISHFYDQRLVPDSIFTQNLYGIAASAPHTQDTLPPSERSTADWIRSREHLPTATDNMTSLTFLMDLGIAFLPLSFNHMWFGDASAVSTLDFSLRLFVDTGELKLDEGWLLRELRCKVAGEGRSFGEGWVWDEGGRCVAHMTQQCILRPLAKGKGEGKENEKEKGKL